MARLLRDVGFGQEADCVEGICCNCWTEGCGCDGAFGLVADGLETINPAMEYIADLIWICGSPLAFPIVFFFDKGPETEPPGGGWKMAMIKAPCQAPLRCCGYMLLPCCGQWYMRYQLLEGDMSRYKLWQGYHDGPHCCATRCPNAPCTIRSGTYGEEKCPHAFLAAEVCCLAGAWSVCCSFDVNRRMIKDQRNLRNDPLENQVQDCIRFFSILASQCWCCSCIVCLCSCMVGCCAPGSEGAQECSDEGGRAASACRSCAHTCWRGIWSVKIIAMGCMSAQMDHEMKEGQPLATPPRKKEMDRGDDENTLDDDEDPDAWWKQKK